MIKEVLVRLWLPVDQAKCYGFPGLPPNMAIGKFVYFLF
jgi:hypothetical protein